jgi:hypothetical protein
MPAAVEPLHPGDPSGRDACLSPAPDEAELEIVCPPKSVAVIAYNMIRDSTLTRRCNVTECFLTFLTNNYFISVYRNQQCNLIRV